MVIADATSRLWYSQSGCKACKARQAQGIVGKQVVFEFVRRAKELELSKATVKAGAPQVKAAQQAAKANEKSRGENQAKASKPAELSRAQEMVHQAQAKERRAEVARLEEAKKAEAAEAARREAERVALEARQAMAKLRDQLAGSSISNPIPEGWEALFDETSGRYYYFHKESGNVTWERPKIDPPASVGVATTPRTFMNSNFKKIYTKTVAPAMQHQLMGCVWEIILTYATTHGVSVEAAKQYFDTLQREAFMSEDGLQMLLGDIPFAAQRLWTSAQSLSGPEGKRLEFCSMLNFLLKSDNPKDMVHVAPFVRAVNRLAVVRGVRDSKTLKFPLNGELFRGGSFRNEYKSFFKVGVKYRTPAFVATSVDIAVANHFIYLATEAGGESTVRWHVLLDARGERDMNWRCKHVSYVSKSLLEDKEAEYLFAPYSAFEVVEVCWSDRAIDGRYPHKITIRAAVDNMDEPEDLPLAPWH